MSCGTRCGHARLLLPNDITVVAVEAMEEGIWEVLQHTELCSPISELHNCHLLHVELHAGYKDSPDYIILMT